MLGERGDSAECLATLVTLDLHPAVCVHSLVSTQIGELGVGLVAHLAPEGLHAAVDVGVLLEAGGGGECLAALWTGVTPGPHMRGPDVPLEVAGVSEHFVAILAGEPPELTVNHLVSEQVWPPGKTFVTVFTKVLVRLIPMVFYHVFVQSIKRKKKYYFCVQEEKEKCLLRNDI